MSNDCIQINTARDRLNFLLHVGAQAALLGIAVSYSNSLINSGVAIAIGTTNFAIDVSRPHSAAYSAMLSAGFIKLDANAPLQKAANEIAVRLKIRKAPTVYAVDTSREPDSKNDPRTAETRLDDNIYVSDEFCNRYDVNIQRPIIAHEIAHIEASHAVKGVLLTEIGTATWALTALSALSEAGNVFGESADWKDVATKVAAFGGAWVISKLLAQSNSRAAEYQADRVAAQVTSPAETADMLAFLRNMAIKSVKPDAKTLARADKAHSIIEFCLKHPTTVNRIKRVRTWTLSNN